MSLSQDTVGVLKACHPLLKEGREVIGAAFYDRLFKEHPQVVFLVEALPPRWIFFNHHGKPMFRNGL